MDGVAHAVEMSAGFVDILHPVGEVSEIAATGVIFRVPVMRQLDARQAIGNFPAFITRAGDVLVRGQENQGETARLTVEA